MHFSSRTRPIASLLKHSALLLVLGCLLFYSATSHAVTPEPPTSPGNYVVDLAGIVDSGVQTRLNAYLKELEQKTTVQMVVLTIKSLDGDSIDDFSLRMAHDKWKLGQKGKDNGLLLTVAVDDHKYRIEVGYGLEGTLPDSMVGTIGRQYLVPYFKKGDYNAGIFNASLEIIKTIAAAQGVEITGMPKAAGIKSKREKRLRLERPYLVRHTSHIHHSFHAVPQQVRRLLGRRWRVWRRRFRRWLRRRW